MKAVVFSIDPPFELVLISAILCVFVVTLLVIKPGYFLTEVFVEDEGEDETTLVSRIGKIKLQFYSC